MDNSLISVIMPVYNVESYLPRAIESVLNQTYKNIELLIVDDGSTDRSSIICDEYANKDSRIRVFHKMNEGQAEARNIGLDNAVGEWIAFLDSDDWIEPTMYELLIKANIDKNTKLAACKTQYFVDEQYYETKDTNTTTIYTISEVLKLLLNNNVIRFEVWNKLWSSDIIGDIRFKKGQVSEEVYFDFEVFKRIEEVAYLDTSLHHYLISRKGNTKSRFRIERMCIFDEFESYIQYLKKNGYNEDASVVACIASMFCISVFLEAVDKHQSKELKNRLRHLFSHFVKTAYPVIKYKRKAIILFALSPKLYNYLLNKRLSSR